MHDRVLVKAIWLFNAIVLLLIGLVWYVLGQEFNYILGQLTFIMLYLDSIGFILAFLVRHLEI